MRRRRLYSIAVLAATALLPSYATADPPREITITPVRLVISEVYEARVVEVIDGSTLLVRHESATGESEREGRRTRLRLFGVRAPAPNEPGARAAVAYLKTMAEGQKVRVEARRNDAAGGTEARITVLPSTSPSGGNGVSSTASRQRRAGRPALSVGATRIPDATGTRADLPRGTEMGTASSKLMTTAEGETAAPVSLNVALVREGLARRHTVSVRNDTELDKLLTEAETSAKKEKKGLWATP